jgi:hypothetical protein
MSEQPDRINQGDPARFPDGRLKTSPDDTSLLGLSAVWSELDEPLPAKGTGGKRGASGRHGGRAARRRARRQAKAVPRPVLIGLGVALLLALGVTAVLVILLLA